jgi:hypothetical protein
MSHDIVNSCLANLKYSAGIWAIFILCVLNPRIVHDQVHSNLQQPRFPNRLIISGITR